MGNDWNIGDHLKINIRDSSFILKKGKLVKTINLLMALAGFGIGMYFAVFPLFKLIGTEKENGALLVMGTFSTIIFFFTGLGIYRYVTDFDFTIIKEKQYI